MALRSLAFATLLSGSGCNEDRLALHTAAQATALSEAMTATVRDGPDKQVAVEHARARLRAEGPALAASVVALKRLSGWRLSDPVQTQWREAFIASVAHLETLRADVGTTADPDVRAALDQLIADYTAILARRPRPD